ncbi:MAG: carboxypeptidase-like regulatory domain-containing protein [Terriglobia bacterium]
MKRNLGAYVVVCTLAGLFLPLGLQAQTNTGVIVGTVTDPTGAVIPGAKVSITHTELQAVTELETDGVGAYGSPVLRAGPYEIRVEMSGFQTYVQRNIVLHVNDRLQINVELQPGAATQVIEVTEAPALLETQSGDVSSVIEARTIVDLPLDGRRYIDLMLLSPGVVAAPGLRSNPREGRFSVVGNDSLQNYFVLAGVDNNSFTQNAQDRSPQVARPAPDALREFKIQTRTYSAEFGYAMGGVVNAEIKSGTNEVHGATWFFHRNDNRNANDFLANRAGLGKAEEIRNQWGFAVGGPLVRD